MDRFVKRLTSLIEHIIMSNDRWRDDRQDDDVLNVARKGNTITVTLRDGRRLRVHVETVTEE